MLASLEAEDGIGTRSRFFAHRRARFCLFHADTCCFTSLTLRLDETQSHRMRQFPQLQLFYLAEKAHVPVMKEKVWNGLIPAQ